MTNEAKAGMIIGAMGIVVFAAVIFLGPFITQWAWHHFMTPVFGVRPITWTEAFALGILGTAVGRPQIKWSKK
jgi:hypothetical protein